MKSDVNKLVLVGVLPVLADIIEDEYGKSLRFNVKKKARELVDEIRKMDEATLEGSTTPEHEEQIRIGQSFRQWIHDHFDFYYYIPGLFGEGKPVYGKSIDEVKLLIEQDPGHEDLSYTIYDQDGNAVGTH